MLNIYGREEETKVQFSVFINLILFSFLYVPREIKKDRSDEEDIFNLDEVIIKLAFNKTLTKKVQQQQVNGEWDCWFWLEIFNWVNNKDEGRTTWNKVRLLSFLFSRFLSLNN